MKQFSTFATLVLANSRPASSR